MSELGLLTEERSRAIVAANRQLDRRLVEAVGKMDAAGVMACFLDSPDLAVVLDGEVRGFTALRGYLTSVFSRVKMVRLETNTVASWRLGETVFTAGIVTCEFARANGLPAILKECWTDARQNVSGRWVFVLLHAGGVG